MALLEELVEEVLLRFPPADPASLVRAALVCKLWCRLVSGRRFRRRFREFHRSQPMLGFLCNLIGDNSRYITRFVPTSTFRPPRADHREWRARDARHGRVLLSASEGSDLAVWDPITDEWRDLPPELDVLDPLNWNAAVLCSARGDCDHLVCHGGPFLVVSACTGPDPEHMSLRIYSSEAGSWSEPTYAALAPAYGVDGEPTALVGNALYFAIDGGCSILGYDVATRETSVIHLPPPSETEDYLTVLMAMEDGGMGVARAEGPRLSLWSMETSPNGDIGWEQIRVIELDKLLSVSALSISSHWVGFTPGTSVFFVNTDDGLFTLDLKSDQVKMVLKENCLVSVVPYMSFYTPALGLVAAGEGPEVEAASV